MREIACSIEEVCERHDCVDITPLAPVGPPSHHAPETMLLITGCGDIGPTLTASLPIIHMGYELTEVYVQPTQQSEYEPLEERHMPLSGNWAVAARRRLSANDVRIVGIMLAKDEADAIPEVIASLLGRVDALYYLAGDPATAEAIVACAPNPAWARAIKNPGLPHADGLRQFLLEQARADALTDGDPRPMWVMNAQGDEIYHDDLRHYILLAHAERATVLNAQVATFLLHESQREGWDWTQPLEKRMTHYIWDFPEHAAFLDFPWTYYVPSEHMRAHPHGMFPGKWAKAWPVRKHYPFRSPEQAAARLTDRLKTTATHPHGSQPHYKNYQHIFVGDRAADREVKKYFGWFPEADRPGGW